MHQQLSLFSSLPSLSGVMPAIRASMRRAAGDSESDGRKLLVDKLNAIARAEGIQLTGGNQKSISKDTLDKWLSPSDATHAPGVLAILAFCRAAETTEPLRILLKAVMPGGMLLPPEEVKFYRLGKAETDLKAARKRKRQIEEQL